MTHAAPSVFLSARGIGKRFGPIRALDGVSVDFRRGEVHAVVGENGAGKSTLMKILAGEETPDSGEILIEGALVRLATPAAAQAHAIAMVHQPFQLVDAMTVAENMCLGRPPRRPLLGPLRLLDRKQMMVRAADELRLFGLADRVRRRIRDMPVAERQIVEIAKALAREAQLLILDEPTSSLDAGEVQRLFAHIRALRERGTAVVFIAHSIEEVLAIADRVTVLRDGRLIASQPAQGLDVAVVVRMIVGRDLAKGYPKAATAPGDPILSADAIVLSGERSLSFSLRRGEIVGMPSHIGSAIDDVLETLSGEKSVRLGSIAVEGRDTTRFGLRRRIRSGLCLVPGDAMAQGLAPKMTVGENILLPNLRHYRRFGIVRRRAARPMVRDLIRMLDIRPPDPAIPVERLSGGNRQKVVIAKWLAAGAKILVMDDPTKGVDVGAKVEIYRVMADMTVKGTATILASSDLDELLGLADRILVLREGQLVEEFAERPFEKARVLARMVGREQSAA